MRQKLKKHEKPLTVIAAILLLSVGVAYAFLNTGNPNGTDRVVTFYDQGSKSVIITRTDTVEGALKAADIEIGAQDQVEPSLRTTLDSRDNEIIIYRSRLIIVTEGSTRRSIATVAQSPNAILSAAGMNRLGPEDTTKFIKGDLVADGTAVILSVKRFVPEPKEPEPVIFKSRSDALTPSKGAQVFVDSIGVAHRETYYDLPMNIVIGACGAGGTYTIRSDGAKVDQNGYVLVAANLNSYPRCSVVETSLGPGKVYDTGGFAVRHPYGFDLATDWTNYNGR